MGELGQEIQGKEIAEWPSLLLMGELGQQGSPANGGTRAGDLENLSRPNFYQLGNPKVKTKKEPKTVKN